MLWFVVAAMLLTGLFRGVNNNKPFEVTSIESAIASEQAITLGYSVCPNQKIGCDPLPISPTCSIVPPSIARTQGDWLWHFREFDS